MKTNAMTQDKKYFVISKVTCPECNGTGVLSQLVRKQLQEKHTAILVWKRLFACGCWHE